MISTVADQGKVEFMVYDGGMGRQMPLSFLEQPIKGGDGKVFPALDDPRARHGKIVRARCEKNVERIGLSPLPRTRPSSTDIRTATSKRFVGQAPAKGQGYLVGPRGKPYGNAADEPRKGKKVF